MKQTLNSYRFVCNLYEHGIIAHAEDENKAFSMMEDNFPKTFRQWKLECSIPEIVNFNRNKKR